LIEYPFIKMFKSFSKLYKEKHLGRWYNFLNMKKIAIIGSGTWGTALANLFATHGHLISLWSRSEADTLNLKMTRRHKFLEDVLLSENIYFTSDLEEAIKGKEIVILAVPSIAIREVSNKIKPYLERGQIIISVAKGIELDTLMTMTEVIEDVIGKGYEVLALSGPTHAEEVIKGLPTLIVCAGKNRETRKMIMEDLSNEVLRIYTNHDMLGVEICGALKNIVALASGMAEGLGYGDNAKAGIITRGLHEIRRLGIAMGCEEETFYGLSGIGDIVVTAESNNSRNHNAGVLFGKGLKEEEVKEKVGMVIEGINALESAKKLEAKYNVELPIIDVVYNIIRNKLDVTDAINSLFGRKKKNEIKDY